MREFAQVEELHRAFALQADGSQGESLASFERISDSRSWGKYVRGPPEELLLATADITALDGTIVSYN